MMPVVNKSSETNFLAWGNILNPFGEEWAFSRPNGELMVLQLGFVKTGLDYQIIW